MADKVIPPAIIKNLRHELASAISDFKAYDVPSVCVRIGLADGDEQEAFSSKYKYAQRRIAALPIEQVIVCSEKLLSEEDIFKLQEQIRKITELQEPTITKLTRRRLMNLFSSGQLATELEDFEFIRSALPISEMVTPSKFGNYNLEEFLIQHTIRNDDLTQKEIVECLGFLECSTKQLFKILEAITSAEYQSDSRQKELASAINELLRHDGYALVQTGRLSGSPIFKVNLHTNESPSDRNISQTLLLFEPDQIGPRWQSALESRSQDPERAITLARTLLEDVCKWILNEANETWEEADDLPALYRKLAKTLNLAPDNHTEQIFKQILGSCQSVVSALGALRNKLSDAHSIGPNRVRPAERHAELAVNLSGTMATFLVATWTNLKSVKEGV